MEHLHTVQLIHVMGLSNSFLICRRSHERSFLAVDLSGQPSKNAAVPTISLEKSQHSKAHGQWESLSSFSRAQAYLVYPEDPLANSEPSTSGREYGYQSDPHLYATCIGSMLPTEKGMNLHRIIDAKNL